VNFTAIERKVTQQKCDIPVLFLRTFTQQKHTFGYKGEFSTLKAFQNVAACQNRLSATEVMKENVKTQVKPSSMPPPF
jgi:hypothetical protein